MDLNAFIRNNKVVELRNQGKIPAVLYGRQVENINLEVDSHEFEKAYKEAGESTIISLKIGDDMRNVLIHDVQFDPLTDKASHIDFYQVRMDEKITVSVSLIFIGESPAVKDLGGILIRNIHEIEVSALPKDLPHEIKVDISVIKTFDDHIYIKDLPIPSGVEVSAEANEIVASVVAPRSEEELASLEQKPEENLETIKVETEEKKKAKEDAEKEAGVKKE